MTTAATTDRLDPGDRAEIIELGYRYAHTFDGGDFDGFAQLFANGTLHLPGVWKPATGVEEVRQLLDARVLITYDGTPRTNHLMHNPIVELSTDGTARAHVYVQVLQGLDDFPIQTIATGIYHDVVRRGEDGRWEFAERTVEGTMRGDLSRHLRSLR